MDKIFIFSLHFGNKMGIARWGETRDNGYQPEHCHQGEAVDNRLKSEKHWETTVSVLGQPTLAQPM